MADHGVNELLKSQEAREQDDALDPHIGWGRGGRGATPGERLFTLHPWTSMTLS
jgi:hypothetical protein